MKSRLFERTAYLLSKEKGTVYKDPGGRINIALVYPNTYQTGMSNLGYQGIYGLLNSFPDVVCERVFFPSPEDLEEYERSGTCLVSLESRRQLSRFDIIAFSVSFENDYPHIVKMLAMSGIPARSSERTEYHPLMIMGGVCAFYNPEPLAEFFDVCCIGEAEEMLPEFLDTYRRAANRSDLMRAALGIEGIYIPSLYEVSYDGETGLLSRRTPLNDAPLVIRKRTFPDLSSSCIRPSIITPETEFSDMYLLEVMRGCPWSCRFCVAGHIYNPPRKKELDVLREEIRQALGQTQRVGLVGPSLSDYPYAEEVLATEGVDFSITSLRASRKSGRIAGLMKGHRSVSIAPEAGTQRLRDVINKKITEEDILETSRLILEGDIGTLRLYFMIGLPSETREDIEGMVGLVRKVRDYAPRGSVTLSVSTFVPKPFTPFQWHPMEKMKEVKERLRMIKKGLAGTRGVRVFHDVPKYAYQQGVFSVGDRRVSQMIENAAFKSSPADGLAGLTPDFYIFRRKSRGEMLPWDFIDAGVSQERLWEEYVRAVEA